MDAYNRANRANWDDRVPIHMGPGGYDVQKLVDDPERITSVVDFDRRYLGDVRGLSLLHPMCHLGTDTLSWAKLGAKVSGIDFSVKAIDEARKLASALTIDAVFVESELYESPKHLNGTYDIVYTGVGATCWLPDIRKWADVMAQFVRPGGRFYIREYHPMLYTIDEQKFALQDDDSLKIELPYFETSTPVRMEESTSYLGEGTIANATTYTWNHGLGETINALIQSGLTIRRVEEHRFVDSNFLSHMQADDANDGRFELPIHQRDNLPLTYSILAEKC